MKNRTMRLAVLLLALSLITACFVGGTFAKYTSNATATGAATVANWSIEVEGKEIATTTAPEITFNLFDTAAIDTDTNVAETDVTTGKIAPGTKGSFELAVENKSEVNAEYYVTFTVSGADNVPIKFNGEDTLANVDKTAIAMGATDTISIDWEWAFDGDDAVDTAAGIAAPEITVTAAITVDQVD